MASTTDCISPQQAVTLDGLLRERVRRTPQGLAYRSFDRAAGQWCDWSWGEAGREVARWQQALAAEGLSPGERVALLLRNGPQWVWFEQAALGLGLVVVPLYLEDRPDNIAYIVQDAGVRVLLVQEERYGRLRAALESVPGLQRIVLAGDGAGPDCGPRVVPLSVWLPPGKHALAERQGNGDDLATIVYTSGTTGRPKGVMLSHRNILSNTEAALSLERFRTGDLFLSFLPLSHMLERMAGYYLPMMAGCGVAYARSVQQLAEDLQTQRPTILIAVPRVFERVYARIQDGLTQRPPLARALFHATLAVGWRRFLWRQGRSGWSWQLLFWPLLHRLVARKVTARLGGRLRLAVSGGAALAPTVARFFLSLGLDLVQGYGLTETSPVVSVNLPGDNEPASVGRPLPGIEVRLGGDDELLVRGPNVMLGYWNQPEATRAIIDAGGWLHTGDQVQIDAAGRIHITGRLKDILVLSNGEKVPPSEMEGAILLDPLFDHAMLLGEGEAFLAALVVLNPDLWPALAQQLGLDPAAPDSLHAPALHRALHQRIGELLRDFPGYAKVRRVAATLEPWSVDNGLLTPTMKLRRREVQARYRDEIAALFRH
ncbi:AMP-dependent synthetase/ligase [Sulfurivermis fontis]|uniref:AMP-dependent synthetase/ligase n=1 Tax=Sulfurivermis fontis TaxID=1972068 RepID=UPI000FDA0F5C|nr:AMP-dependent synthetase/ligase [Sulfurivermis fontis]